MDLYVFRGRFDLSYVRECVNLVARILCYWSRDLDERIRENGAKFPPRVFPNEFSGKLNRAEGQGKLARVVPLSANADYCGHVRARDVTSARRVPFPLLSLPFNDSFSIEVSFSFWRMRQFETDILLRIR